MFSSDRVRRPRPRKIYIDTTIKLWVSVVMIWCKREKEKETDAVDI